MTLRTLVRAALPLALIVLAGCATSRSEIRLSAPPVATTTTTGPELVIRRIDDARVFVEKSPDPSRPSLGWGGAAAAPPEVKARAIGRKRNTYGMALGDVLLEPGETVVDVLRGHIASALTDAGYRVVDAHAASDGAIQADFVIDKFWAWFDPGFWQITLTGDIHTRVSFESHDAAFEVGVSAEDKRQAAHDRAWVEILDLALSQYRAALSREAARFPRTADAD